MIYQIFYDFFASYFFSDPTIRDRDNILHWISLISSILLIIAVFAVIRGLIRSIIGDDSRRRRKWL